MGLEFLLTTGKLTVLFHRENKIFIYISNMNFVAQFECGALDFWSYCISFCAFWCFVAILHIKCSLFDELFDVICDRGYFGLFVTLLGWYVYSYKSYHCVFKCWPQTSLFSVSSRGNSVASAKKLSLIAFQLALWYNRVCLEEQSINFDLMSAVITTISWSFIPGSILTSIIWEGWSVKNKSKVSSSVVIN